MRAKAAPLQALGDRTSQQPTLFRGRGRERLPRADAGRLLSQKTSEQPRNEQRMTKQGTFVYWAGVSPDAKGTNLYNPILVRYFRRSDRETLSRRRHPGSATLRKQQVMQKSFNEIVEEIVRKDPRFEAAAYEFVKEALEFTIKQNKRSQTGLNVHVTAKELMAGFQQYALKEFGPMAMTVFEYWRVTSSQDVGDIVFNLIGAGVFGKTDSDSPGDFQDGVDFQEAFVAPFEPLKTSTAKRS